VQSWAEQQLVLRGLVTNQLSIYWGEIENSDLKISTKIRELLAWDIRATWWA
jgi:hypothetical protein